MYRAEALRVPEIQLPPRRRLLDTIPVSCNAGAGEPQASVSIRRPVEELDISLLVLHGEAALDDALGGQLP